MSESFYPQPVSDASGAICGFVGGATLLDYFAGQVLVGLLPKLPLVDQLGQYGVKVDDKIGYNLEIARSCYEIAKAMLEARKELE